MRRGTSKTRTDREITIDFEETCSLLAEGKTWAEVHFIINSLRDYEVTLRALKYAYSRRLEKTAQELAPKYEKERMIEDLDAIMLKCMIQFNESIGEQKSVQEQGWVDSSGNIKKPFKVIRKMKSHGATRFLEIYMKALDKKTKLLDLEKAPQFDINVFLKNNKIEDEQGTKMEPIRSEKEAKEFGENL